MSVPVADALLALRLVADLQSTKFMMASALAVCINLKKTLVKFTDG